MKINFSFIQGPSGETNINVPYILLPTFYLIFRAPSEKIGNIWMEAIELALKTSNLTKPLSSSVTSSNLNESFRSNSSASSNQRTNFLKTKNKDLNESSSLVHNNSVNFNLNQNESEIENKHFKEISDKEEAQLSDSDNGKNSSDEACSLNSSLNNDNLDEDDFDNETANCTTVSSNGPNVNNDENNRVIDRLVNNTINIPNSIESSSGETSYMPSPKEEFGEVNYLF